MHAAGHAARCRRSTDGSGLRDAGVRIDTRHLRRDVGTESHLPTRLRVDDLEGTQIQVLARTGQQGFQVLDMGSHDKLVTPALEQINT